MASANQQPGPSTQAPTEKEKDKDQRWYFTAEQLINSPSKQAGIPADRELLYRQQAANLIQCMGQQLHVSQLCINTAIVYMHRFYAFHPFTHFHRNGIAQASLFLAAKVEEQPRKFEHVIKEAHKCLHLPEPTKDQYVELAQDLVFNENVLLQTLGFDVAIDHPHTHVVNTCQLVKATKDLAQTSYFMASNSLHLTTMCLQYKPTVVACFCIHLACKWSRWEIQQSIERKHWFQYIDKTVTMELLQKLTDEFLHIFDLCPSRLKSKMKSLSSSAQAQAQGESKSSGTSNTSSQAISDLSSDQTTNSNHHHRHHHHHYNPSQQHYDHHNSKTSSQVPGSSSHKQPVHAGTSSSNRQRSDRSMPNSYVPTMNQHSSHSSSKSIPPNLHAGGNSRHPSLQGSTSSTQKLLPNSTDNLIHPRDRNRNPMLNSANPSAVHSKTDQRHLSKDPNKIPQVPPDITKSTIMKSDASLYSNNRSDQMKNMAKSQQYTSSSTSSHQMHRTEQQQHPNQKIPINDSFKLNDDSNRIMEHQVNTPPKQSQSNKPTSIFSPDYNSNAATLTLSNQQSGMNRNILPSGVNMKPETVSPSNKKINQYERKSETPKKEKKPDLNIQKHNIPNDKNLMNIGSSGINGSNNNKKSTDVHPSYDTLHLKMANTAPKRAFSDVMPSVKQEDPFDFHREPKMRKMDINYDMMCGISSGLSPKSNDNKYYNHSTNSNQSSNSYDNLFSNDMKSFLGTGNGLETNPALVSSLLKEICTDNKYGSTLNPTSPPPMLAATVIPSSGNTASNKISSNINIMPLITPKLEIPEDLMDMSGSDDNTAPVVALLTTPIKQESLMVAEELNRTKSEKKKKKEKHKNKDKDRSKDREERKKHKKDKERHKERNDGKLSPVLELLNEPASSEARIKITIPKEKLALPNSDMSSGGGFKIKIPKDRIKTEISGGSLNAPQYTGDTSQNIPQSQPPSTNSLKIKISKDLIYSNDSTVTHHSAKKKDRDRERERSNKSSKSDLSKSFNSNSNNNNGGAGGSGSSGGGGGQQMSRNSAANPNQEIWVNM